MRFLKQKSISQYSAADDALMVYDNRPSDNTSSGGRAVMDLSGGLRLPKGTTNQRPQGTKAGDNPNVRIANSHNGYIRYNTTTNAIEAYINSTWEIVKASSSSAIQVSRFAANGTETTFGPLSANTDYRTSYTGSDYNLMVLIDNVMQIGDGVNYTVVKRSAGSFIAVSSSNSPLSASGPGSYTNDEFYIQFATAVPATGGTGQPIYVTVFYGYGN
jgi:hypothetical protein